MQGKYLSTHMEHYNLYRWSKLPLLIESASVTCQAASQVIQGPCCSEGQDPHQEDSWKQKYWLVQTPKHEQASVTKIFLLLVNVKMGFIQWPTSENAVGLHSAL